ncbi:hypothetical protein FRUB_03103 [Fimbriiglobus ruber]|uniref:Putative restriction endonuclease domain-containing protein n=1 Tax=Fimbriiglobus ruber TaxID=1908690 RepID=A0A225DV24_9BACT|nr:hypothetical protein FRUB_03103 [Fimbriiglobus ruber]
MLILDPMLAREFREHHVATDVCRFDEMWEGMLVVPPAPNNEHFRIVSILNTATSSVIDWDAGDQSVPGGNLSDRAADWQHNYRVPDLLVYLAGNPAVDHGTHWEGGPDFLVEIISPGEKPYDKFDFYANVNAREILIVHRDPWALELFQLSGGKYVSAGRSDLSTPGVLKSTVLPLAFRLVAGKTRPKIEVTHPPTGRRWEA